MTEDMSGIVADLALKRDHDACYCVNGASWNSRSGRNQ